MMERLWRLLLPEKRNIDDPDQDRRMNIEANRSAAVEARRLRYVVKRRPGPLLRDFEELVKRLDHPR